jgi:hypothetical protein
LTHLRTILKIVYIEFNRFIHATRVDCLSRYNLTHLTTVLKIVFIEFNRLILAKIVDRLRECSLQNTRLQNSFPFKYSSSFPFKYSPHCSQYSPLLRTRSRRRASFCFVLSQFEARCQQKTLLKDLMLSLKLPH